MLGSAFFSYAQPADSGTCLPMADYQNKPEKPSILRLGAFPVYRGLWARYEIYYS